MQEAQTDFQFSVLTPGIIGTLGALLIVIADIAYNVFDGDKIGRSLYISTFFGVFLFPLWWGGIWVIYQGMKPAGKLWSLYPCLLFAFLVSSINVFLHSSYPYWAAIQEAQAAATGPALATLQNVEAMIQPYLNPIFTVQTIVEATVAIWLTIPIVRGKTAFPRWMAFLIPLYPLVAAYLIGLAIPGFFQAVNPYIASGAMCLIFATATYILHRKQSLVFSPAT